jgi:hypothetical protein
MPALVYSKDDTSDPLRPKAITLSKQGLDAPPQLPQTQSNATWHAPMRTQMMRSQSCPFPGYFWDHLAKGETNNMAGVYIPDTHAPSHFQQTFNAFSEQHGVGFVYNQQNSPHAHAHKRIEALLVKERDEQLNVSAPRELMPDGSVASFAAPRANHIWLLLPGDVASLHRQDAATGRSNVKRPQSSTYLNSSEADHCYTSSRCLGSINNATHVNKKSRLYAALLDAFACLAAAATIVVEPHTSARTPFSSVARCSLACGRDALQVIKARLAQDTVIASNMAKNEEQILLYISGRTCDNLIEERVLIVRVSMLECTPSNTVYVSSPNVNGLHNSFYQYPSAGAFLHAAIKKALDVNVEPSAAGLNAWLVHVYRGGVLVPLKLKEGLPVPPHRLLACPGLSSVQTVLPSTTRASSWAVPLIISRWPVPPAEHTSGEGWRRTMQMLSDKFQHTFLPTFEIYRGHIASLYTCNEGLRVVCAPHVLLRLTPWRDVNQVLANFQSIDSSEQKDLQLKTFLGPQGTHLQTSCPGVLLCRDNDESHAIAREYVHQAMSTASWFLDLTTRAESAGMHVAMLYKSKCLIAPRLTAFSSTRSDDDRAYHAQLSTPSYILRPLNQELLNYHVNGFCIQPCSKKCMLGTNQEVRNATATHLNRLQVFVKNMLKSPSDLGLTPLQTTATWTRFTLPTLMNLTPCVDTYKASSQMVTLDGTVLDTKSVDAIDGNSHKTFDGLIYNALLPGMEPHARTAQDCAISWMGASSLDLSRPEQSSLSANAALPTLLQEALQNYSCQSVGDAVVAFAQVEHHSRLPAQSRLGASALIEEMLSLCGTDCNLDEGYSRVANILREYSAGRLVSHGDCKRRRGMAVNVHTF